MKVGDDAYFLAWGTEVGGTLAVKVYKVKLTFAPNRAINYEFDIVKPMFGVYYALQKGEARGVLKSDIGKRLFATLDETINYVKKEIINEIFNYPSRGFTRLEKIIKTMFAAKKK